MLWATRWSHWELLPRIPLWQHRPKVHPALDDSPASHSVSVAFGLELLATKRQMEKSRQPRSQALIRMALLCRECEGPSGLGWEGKETQAKGLGEEG